MRIRSLIIPAVAAAVAVTTAVPVAAQTASSVRCSTTITGATIGGDVRVPADAVCTLDGVTVEGDVLVLRGADLVMSDSTVNGSVEHRRDSFLDLDGSAIDGDVLARRAFGQLISSSTVGGDVTGIRPEFALLLDARLGSLDVDGGPDRVTELYLESNTLAGNVTADRTAFTDVYDSEIFGSHEVSRSGEGSFLCHSEVDGTLRFDRNGGDLIVGDGTSDCGVSYAGGDATIHGQGGATSLVGTIIRGDLMCDGNASAPSLQDVRVRGAVTGQCADSEADAPTVDSFGTRSAESFGTQADEPIEPSEQQAERGEELLDRVEERRAER